MLGNRALPDFIPYLHCRACNALYRFPDRQQESQYPIMLMILKYGHVMLSG